MTTLIKQATIVNEGKVFVSDLENVIRIRTGETGKEAL